MGENIQIPTSNIQRNSKHQSPTCQAAPRLEFLRHTTLPAVPPAKLHSPDRLRRRFAIWSFIGIWNFGAVRAVADEAT